MGRSNAGGGRSTKRTKSKSMALIPAGYCCQIDPRALQSAAKESIEPFLKCEVSLPTSPPTKANQNQARSIHSIHHICFARTVLSHFHLMPIYKSSNLAPLEPPGQGEEHRGERHVQQAPEHHQPRQVDGRVRVADLEEADVDVPPQLVHQVHI